MLPEDTVFALVVLPLLGAAIALSSKAFFTGKRKRNLEYLGAFVGLVLPWVVMIQLLPLVLTGQAIEGIIGGWHESVGISFRFDGLAWLVNLLGFTIAGAAWLYSLGPGPHGPHFTAVFLIQTSALAATAMTADLFNLFVCLEVMGIASYILIASSEKQGAFLASFSYLMVSATAMVFFLLGIYGIYRTTGALTYTGIINGLSGLPDHGGVVTYISLSLIVGAVAIRVAVMPLYGWLPDSHALAPHAVSSVLSGVLIKTPLFALSRVLLLVPAGMYAGQLMGYAGAITALVAVIIALSQSDAKRLLAYHTVSQIGYVVAAWGAALYVGTHTLQGSILMAGAFLHALYHAMFKGLLFLSIGTTTDCASQRNVYQLRGAARLLKQAGERIPITTITFVVGALAISAIPPFNGFASKTTLSYGLKDSWQYSMLYAAGIGTMASFIKLSRIYWSKPEQQNRFPVPVPNANKIAQTFLAILCLGTGIFAGPMYRFVVTLFAFGAPNGPAPVLYSTQTLMNTLILITGGTAVFLLASTRIGHNILKIIRERPRDFQGLFVAFSLGVTGLSGWLLFWG